MLDHWLSYSLVDFIPVEAEVYVNLFARANTNLWPWTALIASLGIFILLLSNYRQSRYCLLLLGFIWWLSAYQFHFSYLSELHWIGYYFAAIFFLQGCLLLACAIARDCKQHSSRLFWVGMCIMVVAMTFFLTVPAFGDRPWRSVEIAGIAPDPTGWLTIGALVSLNMRHWWLLVIPVSWILLSLSVAYVLYLDSSYL